MRLRAIFYAYSFKANSIKRAFTLFQRDILLAYRDIDTEIADVALKYFLKRATCWLSPKNVALSVYGETPLYSVEAVKVCMLPDTVDIKSHLKDRTTRLKHFFTTRSKKAPCISYSRIPPQFSTTTTDQTNAKLGG